MIKGTYRELSLGYDKKNSHPLKSMNTSVETHSDMSAPKSFLSDWCGALWGRTGMCGQYGMQLSKVHTLISPIFCAVPSDRTSMYTVPKTWRPALCFHPPILLSMESKFLSVNYSTNITYPHVMAFGGSPGQLGLVGLWWGSSVLSLPVTIIWVYRNLCLPSRLGSTGPQSPLCVEHSEGGRGPASPSPWRGTRPPHVGPHTSGAQWSSPCIQR